MAQPATATLNAHGVPPCPECGKDDFKAKTAWGLHRRQKHNVLGNSQAAQAVREQKALRVADASALTCDAPGCGEQFQNAKALGIHKRWKHGIAGRNAKPKALTLTAPAPEKAGKSNGSSGASPIHHGRDTASNHLTESPESIALVGIAIGEVKGICRAIAEASGYPTRELTCRVAEYLFRETRRG